MFDCLKRRAVRVTIGPLAAALGGQDANTCEYRPQRNRRVGGRKR
jgi:hypothetical protein